MPAITSVHPVRAVEGGRITILGSSFSVDDVTTVQIGEAAARVAFASSSRLVVIIPAELEGGRDLPGAGGMYVGDEGIIVAQHGGEARLIPESKMAKTKPAEAALPRGESHYEEFIRACRGGPAPLSNFAYAGPLTEMTLLGLVAIQSG